MIYPQTYSQALPSPIHDNYACSCQPYLRRLVVRALHRHRNGVGLIPAEGPIVDEFFSTCVWLPLEFKTNSSFRIYPTSSEVRQNLSLYIRILFQFLWSEFSTKHWYRDEDKPQVIDLESFYQLTVGIERVR